MAMAALEWIPLRLNRDSQAGRKGGVLACDSVFGMRHDQALFGGFAGACGCSGRRGSHATRGGGALWCQRQFCGSLAPGWRHEGTIEAKPYGGSRSPLDDHAAELLAVIEEQPDLTLDEIVAVMRKRQIPGSRTALFRFLERRAVTPKKSPSRGRTGADGCGPRPPAMDTRAGLA